MQPPSTIPLRPGARLPAALQRHFQQLLDVPLPPVRLASSRKLASRGIPAACQGRTIYLTPAACAAPPQVLLHILAHEVAHIAQQLLGKVRLRRTGPARTLHAPALDSAADRFAARACASWPAGVPVLLVSPPPVAEPAGAWLAYPIVRNRPDLPRDAAGWLARFNQFGRREVELKRVLSHLEAKQMELDDEKELVYLVRMVVEKLRRPTISGTPVRLGIPYRDDGGGKAIAADVGLVQDGTLCDVVVLVPATFKGRSGVEWVEKLHGAGLKAVVAAPDCSLTALDIHGLYVSGGPHDHPNTVGVGRPRDPRNRADEAEERHVFEVAMINCAKRENIPLLGICGGSWRVAGTLGASIERLSPGQAKVHAGPMTQPQEKQHEVTINPASMLDQILRTDNYRNVWPTRHAVAGQPLTLPVNSVHWAHSVFPYHSDTIGSAQDGNVTEAFETPGQHFQVGIQWHPEYAQNGLNSNGTAESSMVGEQHRRIMAALGDAATDGRAARVLQRALRRKLAGRGQEVTK